MSDTARFHRSLQFRLLDTVVVIAATAAGFALTRGLWGLQGISAMDAINSWIEPGSFSGRSSENAAYFTAAYGRSLSRYWYGLGAFWTQRIALWSCPCLCTWTIAVAVLALISPRPPLRRLLRRPGILASMAFVVGLFGLALVLPRSLIGKVDPTTGGWLYWQDWWIAICFALPRPAALAISTAWITLGASGRCRPDRGWLDRLGMVLGGCWIFLGVIRVISSWLAVLVG